jgi:hypothetical protein
LTLAGAAVAGLGEHRWAAALLLGSGAVGFAVTIAKNVTYALRSDVGSLPGSRLWYRAVVAYLHFLQPFARAVGQIRGVLSPPEVALPAAPRQTSRGPRPSIRDVARAAAALEVLSRTGSGARRGPRPIACSPISPAGSIVARRSHH